MKKQNEITLQISKDIFLDNLEVLKSSSEKNPFGFMENQYIDFNRIRVSGSQLIIERKTNILSLFRGTGMIEAKLVENDNSSLKVSYKVKPDFNWKVFSIVWWMILAFWITAVVLSNSNNAILLITFGLITGVILTLAFRVLQRINANSLEKYLQKAVETIKDNGLQHAV